MTFYTSKILCLYPTPTFVHLFYYSRCFGFFSCHWNTDKSTWERVGSGWRFKDTVHHSGDVTATREQLVTLHAQLGREWQMLALHHRAELRLSSYTVANSSQGMVPTNRSATVLHQAFPRVCGADHWHYLSHPSGIFCGFIYISIMNNRAKHLFCAYESFVYLFWEKWLWRDFGQFKRSDLQRSCVWFWFLWWIHYVGQTDLKVTQPSKDWGYRNEPPYLAGLDL